MTTDPKHDLQFWHTHRARNQTAPVINTHAPADPRHCCVTITRTWIHFHPEQAMFTHAYETRKQCVGYTTTFTQAFRKTQPEIHTVYIYACSSLLYETIIKHICMVQTWCRWFLPAEEAVHACSQSNRTENKTSETFFSAKGTAAHLKQTSTCGRKWKTNEKGAERGTTYGKRKRSATQQERGEGNRKIERESVWERERGTSVWVLAVAERGGRSCRVPEFKALRE